MNMKRRVIGLLGIASTVSILGIFDAKEGYSEALLGRLAFFRSGTAWAQDSVELSATEVYQKVIDSVVEIRTPTRTGSGFVFNSDGLILTNAHVIDGSPNVVTVVFADGRQMPADVIGFHDGNLDLAALRIYSSEDLPDLTFSEPESLREGEQVYAVGSPFSIGISITAGLVSRIDRDNSIIQTDAPINPGNSGGPLVNSRGEVVGVNTRIHDVGIGANVGIGYAIAANEVKAFAVAAEEGQVVATRSTSTSAPPEVLTVDGRQNLGLLDESSRLSPIGAYFNMYVFEGAAGQEISIGMSSQELDPFLEIYLSVGPDSNGNYDYQFLAQHDDISQADLSAQLSLVLPENSEYLVIARSFAKETGSYMIGAASGLVSGEDKASEDVRFFCGEALDPVSQENLPTTLAYIPGRQGKISIIYWKSQYFEQFGLTNQQRCIQASSRFQKAYDEGRLGYLRTDILDDQPVVCAVRAQGESCGNNYLFELKPNNNPDLVLEQLAGIITGDTTSPVYQSPSEEYIDMQELLWSKPLEAE